MGHLDLLPRLKTNNKDNQPPPKLSDDILKSLSICLSVLSLFPPRHLPHTYTQNKLINVIKNKTFPFKFCDVLLNDRDICAMWMI